MVYNRYRRRLTRLITGASGEFFIFIGWILSQMMRFSLALDNHSCLTLSVDVACVSSDISVMPIPVKTIPELFSRAFWALPLSETGIAELADRDNLGWGQLRTIHDLSISAWRQQGGALSIDRHGGYSWRWLRLLDMLLKERDVIDSNSVIQLKSCLDIFMRDWGFI